MFTPKVPRDSSPARPVKVVTFDPMAICALMVSFGFTYLLVALGTWLFQQ